MTVKVFPAMVSTPDRCVVPVLAAATNPVLPLPEPLAPLEMVIQVAALDAVQAQPVVVATVTMPLPPFAGTDIPVAGEIE